MVTEADDDSWKHESPPTDESGDVDLSLIWACLSLTPAERLQQVEQFASLMIEVRQRRGLPWTYDLEPS